MRDTRSVGDRTEAICLAHLLRTYETVLIPFGNGRRYDLVVDDGSRFLRVQCKTGSLRKGVIEFNTASITHPAGGITGRRHYRGQVDYFAVYCQATDRVYLVPVDDVGISKGYLRLDASLNSQTKGLRWAKDYEMRFPEGGTPA
jgi:PD-(D/E)XK endonuclease